MVKWGALAVVFNNPLAVWQNDTRSRTLRHIHADSRHADSRDRVRVVREQHCWDIVDEALCLGYYWNPTLSTSSITILPFWAQVGGRTYRSRAVRANPATVAATGPVHTVTMCTAVIE